MFKPINRYFKKIGNTKSISSWKSKGLSDEVIKPSTINNNSLAPTLEYAGKKMCVKFNGSCLIKQGKFTFDIKTVNIYIVCDIDSNLNNFDPTLKNCLFGATQLTKNSDIGKYKYSGENRANSFENFGIYYIGYITKKDEYKINSLNPLYLIVREIYGFNNKKEGSKYLNITLTDSNSEVLKKYAEIWSGINSSKRTDKW